MQVYMWLAQWLLLPLLYHSTPLGTSIRTAMASGWFYGGSSGATTAWNIHHLQALSLLIVLTTFAALYRLLYGSDPGFFGQESDAKHLQMEQAFAFACPYCGSRPTNRSHHSKVSGQCVHKFDHSCWLLSTDVGDRNHRAFWVYLVLQVCVTLMRAHETLHSCSLTTKHVLLKEVQYGWLFVQELQSLELKYGCVIFSYPSTRLCFVL